MIESRVARRPIRNTDGPYSGDVIDFAMPEGCSKVTWEFAATGERGGEVYVHHGYIDAWLLDGQTDVDGAVTLLPGPTPPAWVVDPEVDGTGSELTLTLQPNDAVWRTMLHRLDAS